MFRIEMVENQSFDKCFPLIDKRYTSIGDKKTRSQWLDFKQIFFYFFYFITIIYSIVIGPHGSFNVGREYGS